MTFKQLIAFVPIIKVQMKKSSDFWITRHVVLMSIIAHIILAIALYLQGDLKLSIIITGFVIITTLFSSLSSKQAAEINKYLIIVGPALIPVIELRTGLNNGLFLGFSYAPIYILVVILLLFKSSSNKKTYHFLLLVSFLYTLFYDQILYLTSVEQPNIEFILEEYIYYKVPVVLTWIFILLSLGYYINVSKFMQNQIADQNQKLTIQKEKVQQINAGLELNIIARNRKAIIQNQKILKYSNLLYHDVRGPLARIMGLNNLMKRLRIDNETELAELTMKMDEATRELDQVIRAIGKELSAGKGIDSYKLVTEEDNFVTIKN